MKLNCCFYDIHMHQIMSSKKGSNISFRFNKHEENQLEEVLNDDFCRSSIESEQSSTSSTPVKVKSSTSDNSVKDFITSKLARGRSLDQSCPSDDVNISPSSSSKWLNDSWKKFQQMIEEKKEKSANKNKDVQNPNVSPTFSSNSWLPDPDIDVRSSEGDAIDNKVILNLIPRVNEVIPSTESSDQLEPIAPEKAMCPKDLPLLSHPVPRPQPRNIRPIYRRTSSPLLSSSPSCPSFLSTSRSSSELWQLGNPLAKAVYISSSISALIAILLTNKLPFPSFLNGFILGIIISFLLLGVFILYIISKILKNSDNEIPACDSSLLDDCSPTDSPSSTKELFPIDETSAPYKEWFYELVSCQELSSSEKPSEKPRYKTKLVFVRLQGNYLRLSEPHSKNLKSRKLTENSYTNFVSQRHYDLLNLRRIYLWLPNSVRNKKKYLWLKKYPIVLEIACSKKGDPDNQESDKLVRLILFSRTCRTKEEWYWRFREASKELYLDSVEDITCIDDFEELIASPPSVSGKELPSSRDATPSLLNAKYESYMHQILNHKPSVFMPGYLPADDSHLLWFNAILSRVFFEFLNSEHWSKWLTKKIQRKLTRLKLPYFMQTLTLKDIELGPSLPRFLSVPKHPSIAEDGLWVDFQIYYSGGFAMTLETKLNLMRLKDSNYSDKEKSDFKPPSSPTQPASTPVDPSEDLSDAESIVPSSDDDENSEFKDKMDTDAAKILKFVDKIAASKYFQHATDNKFIKKAMEGVSNMPLILNVYVQELSGILSINFPPPPSDRMWYGFRDQPNLVLSARPRLGDHRVSMSHAIEWIEKKLQEEFCKQLVIPNMDDILIQVMMAANSNIDIQ